MFQWYRPSNENRMGCHLPWSEADVVAWASPFFDMNRVDTQTIERVFHRVNGDHLLELGEADLLRRCQQADVAMTSIAFSLLCFALVQIQLLPYHTRTHTFTCGSQEEQYTARVEVPQSSAPATIGASQRHSSGSTSLLYRRLPLPLQST